MVSGADFAPDTSWDWPKLYYAGTVILRMSDRQFWHETTPRKLVALLRVHNEIHNPELKQNKQVFGYIDQVL